MTVSNLDTVAVAQGSPDTEQPWAELGLKEDEYARIREILGRRPTDAELAMYSVMWSEHCSYKSSKVHLRYFGQTTTDEMRKSMLAGIGENAGVVDIGDGWAVTFKVESHNHPSYIEPYQGAATGVGGILRDVVAGEPPAVFGGRGWYALPAILGAGTTAALGQAEVLNPLTSAAVMVLVLVLRVVSLRREWLAPGAEISGETQRQRLDPHDEPPVPDIRDRKGRDGPPAAPGEDGPPANEETPGAGEDVTPPGTPG